MLFLTFLCLFLLTFDEVVLQSAGVCLEGAPTVQSESYEGAVVPASIPAAVCERDGRLCASSRGAVPIHCCEPDEVSRRGQSTIYYCDVFTSELLAPLEDVLLVRLDQRHAERVVVNRTKRLLLTSSDGRLAQWRCAPTFRSTNRFLAGTPVTNTRGQLVTLLTARQGDHYALSGFTGDGGYFDTPLAWSTVDPPRGALVYGDRLFADIAALKAFVATLPGTPGGPLGPARPVLVRAPVPRLALVAPGGRQLAHYYLHGVSTDLHYL